MRGKRYEREYLIEALQAAGIPPDPRMVGYDRETLLDHLRALTEQLGRTPTYSDVDAVDGCPGRKVHPFYNRVLMPCSVVKS